MFPVKGEDSKALNPEFKNAANSACCDIWPVRTRRCLKQITVLEQFKEMDSKMEPGTEEDSGRRSQAMNNTEVGLFLLVFIHLKV